MVDLVIMKKSKNSLQIISEYIQALVAAVVLAVIIRGFVYEPFKIPSESMVPTLLVGDHIFVARYKYGLRVPFTKIWLKEFAGPKRGDVAVFSYPEDEDVDFIKRVVGLPGDKIGMHEGKLLVNDQEVTTEDFLPIGQNEDDHCVQDLSPLSASVLPQPFKPFPYYGDFHQFDQKVETFPSHNQHMIQRSKYNPRVDDFEYTVPERSYFVMGDNRDQSQDSRFWGIVPRENLKGQAIYIWISLNNQDVTCRYNFLHTGFLPGVRWDRFGRKII